MSIRPVKRIVQSKPTHGRRRREAAPRLRLRRHHRVRSVPAVRRFPQRPAGRLSRRLSLASASRHRDHHLRARRHGRARRQPRQPRHARRRRRAVDDGRQRHHAPGNAAGRRAGPHARLPALGEPAVVAEDDGAALPGRQGRRHSRGRRRRRHARARRRAATSGARRARSTASPPIRAISTSPCRRASARRCRSRPSATPSPMCSRLRERSATRRSRSAC